MKKNTKDRRIKIGISCGDINGVGMEVIMKSFTDQRILSNITPIIYGYPKVANIYKKVLRMNDFNFNVIQKASEAKAGKVNLLCVDDTEFKVEIGKETAISGEKAFQSLKHLIEDITSDEIDAMVTAPINKSNIQSKDFNFPGHTEYLAHVANEENFLMTMVSEDVKVALVTNHLPLKEVATAITKDGIKQKAYTLLKTLQQDFGVNTPKIAVLGLNPHSGDNGLLGEEEKEVISPAIDELYQEGHLCFGPFSADGFFGSNQRHQFDGILAMYHDQGLAPFKTISFGRGVNYTAGLPIVRTSPDHGTAYDIAGKNEADPGSFTNALWLAHDIYIQRKLERSLGQNPLKKHDLKEMDK